eukprot:127710-Pyramimonas_sp.AAC.1
MLPAVQDGTGGGAIHPKLSDKFIDFLKRGNVRAEFDPWQDHQYFLPRCLPFCPGMHPEGKRLRLPTEGVQNDQHMRPAVEELSKVMSVAEPSGPAAS